MKSVELMRRRMWSDIRIFKHGYTLPHGAEHCLHIPLMSY